jgi:O-acetyl-ADP-ribose deacetylase (regulator of RNase III)
MIKLVRGNLLTRAEIGMYHYIVHGCNCFHAMGSGIARQIADKYPSAVVADNQTVRGDRSKLGTYSISKHVESVFDPFCIVNAYTQFSPSRGEDVFEYEAFEMFLQNFAKDITANIGKTLVTRAEKNIYIGFPKIGCGLARGDFDRIMDILLTWSDKNPLFDVEVVSL